MIGKSVISLIIFLIITFTTYLITIGGLGAGGIGTVDLRSQFSFLSSTRNGTLIPCRTGSPLRVYMYDLPKKFNVAMLSRKFAGEDDSSPVTARNLPPWPLNSGLKQQHSVEYWMMASILCENCTDAEAVRVLDPEAADVFFVPFFSSLSFNTHGRNMTDPDTEIDRQLQIEKEGERDLISFSPNHLWKMALDFGLLLRIETMDRILQVEFGLYIWAQ